MSGRRSRRKKSSRRSLLNHQLLKPIAKAADSAWPPQKDVEALATALSRDAELAARCRRLLDREISAEARRQGALGVWLAFALALAGDEPTVGRLWGQMQLPDEQRDGEIPFDLALNALLAAGDPAVRAAAEMLEAIDPSARPVTPEVAEFFELTAAVCRSTDAELRARVATAVKRHLADSDFPGDWAHDACLALAASAPEDAAGMLPALMERFHLSQKIAKLLEGLRAGRDVRDAIVKTWPWLARSAAESWREAGELQREEMERNDTGSELAPPDEACVDADEFEDDEFEDDDEAVQQRRRDLIDEFLSSERCPVAEEKREECAYDLYMILDYLWNFCGCRPEHAHPEDIRELMEDVLPRKVTAEPESYSGFAHWLSLFYEFLLERHHIRGGSEILKAIKASTPRMLRRARDPSSWGMAKTMATSMARDGIDLNDQTSINEWIIEYNRRILGDLRRYG